MDLVKALKKMAIEFAAQNTLVEYGEIVETLWGSWKKPHRVKIYDIGAALSLHNWKIVDGRRDYSCDSLTPAFAMFYYALRLKADGSPKDKEGKGGIVLNNFKKDNGTVWQETNEVLNHAGYHWTLPK